MEVPVPESCGIIFAIAPLSLPAAGAQLTGQGLWAGMNPVGTGAANLVSLPLFLWGPKKDFRARQLRFIFILHDHQGVGSMGSPPELT